MKTHIIRLESHDDRISIRDKIAWSRAPRILLAFPRRRPPPLSRLDLIIIQRAGLSAGGQVGLVAIDSEIREHAADIGIPVFPSIPAAQRMPWRPTRKKKRTRWLRPLQSRNELDYLRRESIIEIPRPYSPWVRLFLFLLGVGSFLALIAFFLPRATIVVQPEERTQEINLVVWASPDVPAVLPSGAVPVRLEKLVIEDEISESAVELIPIPDESASGKVTLTNLTEQAIHVPAGTRFRTTGQEPVQVESIEGVSVPAGVGQQAEVHVRARQPGTQGNLPAGAIQAVEGAIGLSITVNNPEPLQGGTLRSGRVGGMADYDRLSAELTSAMEQHALAAFHDLAGERGYPIPESLVLVQILQEEREPAPGTPTDLITVKLQAEFSIWVVDKADLEAVARMALDAGLEDGLTAVDGTLKLEFQNDPLIDEDGQAKLELRVSRTTREKLDRGQIATLVLGVERARAIQLLEQYLALTSAPDIDIWPGFWGRLPFLALRIEVLGP